MKRHSVVSRSTHFSWVCLHFVCCAVLSSSQMTLSHWIRSLWKFSCYGNAPQDYESSSYVVLVGSSFLLGSSCFAFQ
ncbi:hypothetical protein M758_5G093400 [Ceratodon purpureus]|nr:hypothetical protein M758_5G093400 [Ceratodon purpureus]